MKRRPEKTGKHRTSSPFDFRGKNLEVCKCTRGKETSIYRNQKNLPKRPEQRKKKNAVPHACAKK